MALGPAPTHGQTRPASHTKATGGATPPKPVSSGKTQDDPYGGLTGSDRDAAVYLENLFDSYGLKSLAPVIIGYIKDGYKSDAISELLVQTDQYKQRFAGNEARLKAGLPVLSPAEYLATEDSYRQVMSAAGLPVGFYDNPSDFTKWIAADVSPTEVQQRVSVASDLINNSDPNTLAYFKQHYTTGDLTAYALDRKRAAPLIQQQYAAAQIGGAAKQQGIDVSTASAQNLAKLGVSQGQAQSGFAQVASQQGNDRLAGAIYGQNVSQDDVVANVFGTNADSTKKLKTLASRQRAAFGGSGGVGQSTLKKDSGGQF